MTKKKKRKPKFSDPVAKWMITSGLFHSHQVPDKRKKESKEACRGKRGVAERE